MTDASREAFEAWWGEHHEDATNYMDAFNAGWQASRAEQAQAVEPVASLSLFGGKKRAHPHPPSDKDIEIGWMPLYLHPVPAWVPMTEKLLNTQEPWLYQPIWIAGAFGVEQATYEWRQGRNPHCFDTTDGDCRDLSEITHAMPIVIPAAPQGAKP
jgi:hypothetical protein